MSFVIAHRWEKLETCVSDEDQEEASSGNRPFQVHACHEARRDDDYHRTLDTTNSCANKFSSWTDPAFVPQEERKLEEE
jgi:hypothetical protein